VDSNRSPDALAKDEIQKDQNLTAKSNNQSCNLSQGDSGEANSLHQTSATDRQALYEQYKNKLLTEDVYASESIDSLEKIFANLAEAAVFATMSRSWRQLQTISTYAVNI